MLGGCDASSYGPVPDRPEPAGALGLASRRIVVAARGSCRGRSPTGPSRAGALGPYDWRRARRRLHARTASVRLDDRAASARRRPGDAARAEPAQLPGLHAAPGRAGGRRAVRRRRGHGAPRRRRRRRARGGLRRRRAAPAGDRADAAGTPARPAARRGARGRAAADAPLGSLRGLRRAHRRPARHRGGLDRALRPLRRRAAGDGAAGRGGAPPPGCARKRAERARRDVLRGARARRRVPALHEAGRVSRLAGAGGAPLREPRADRGLAARPEPRPLH